MKKKKDEKYWKKYRKFSLKTSFHRQLLQFFFSKCFAWKQTEPQANRKHQFT